MTGDGAFELVRLYEGWPFALGDHLDRLERSAAALGLELDRGALREEIEELLGSVGGPDGQLRLVVAEGGRRSAAIEPLPAPGEAVSTATVRSAPSAEPAGARSLRGAAEGMRATREAQERGAEEAILVRPDGVVVEAPGASVFWVTPEGDLRTPAPSAGALGSIARSHAIEVLGADEGEWPDTDLHTAPEAFLVSLTREVQPIASIDGRSLGETAGRHIRAAREAFASILGNRAGGGRPRDGESPPILQYWHEEDVPEEVLEATGTFRERNPELEHLLFHEADAEQFIAAHLGPRELRAFRSCAVPAMQADYFRYCFLARRGGVWVDVDFRCLRALTSMIEPDATGLMFRPKEIDVPTNNCFLMFTQPGHPMPALLRDVCTVNIERRIGDSVPFVTGPWVLMVLGAIYRLGSLEAAEAKLPDERFVRLARCAAETAGSWDSIAAAFEAVRIVPGAYLHRWIERVSKGMQYKRSEAHWTNWEASGRSIFRDPGGAADPERAGRPGPAGRPRDAPGPHA